MNDSGQFAIVEESEMNTTLVVPGADETAADERGRYLDLVCHGIIVPTICFSGMVLNIINFIVLRDKRLKESSYTYLVGLAVADFLSLLMFGVNGIGRGHYSGQYRWRMFETFVYFPVCLTATTASVFLIVTVTAERFVFLYWPIASRGWCTRSVARRIVACVWIFSVVLNIPRFFVFNVTREGTMERTNFGRSQFYHVLTWIYFVLVAVGCGISLIVFNVLLIKGIHNANQKRRTMKSSSKAEAERREEVRLTRTLISVIFLYLIGEIPSSIFSRLVFSAILGEDNQYVMAELWYSICVCVATIFAVCQHSLNFVFYCVFNKRFYKIFRAKCIICVAPKDCAPNSEIATIVEPSNELLQKGNGNNTQNNGKYNHIDSTQRHGHNKENYQLNEMPAEPKAQEYEGERKLNSVEEQQLLKKEASLSDQNSNSSEENRQNSMKDQLL